VPFFLVSSLHASRSSIVQGEVIPLYLALKDKLRGAERRFDAPGLNFET
jgi:hypothetical protein